MHFVAIVVEGDRARRVPPHANLMRLDGHDVSILVQHLERLRLNLENHTRRLGIELHKIMQLVSANDIHTRADLSRLADVLREDGHFLQRQVREERRDTLFHLDHETCLIRMLAIQHLDVITRTELLPHALRRHLDLLAIKRIVRQLERHNVAAHRIDRARHTSLLALKHLDVVAWLQRRLPCLLGRIRQQVQVHTTSLVVRRLAREVEHFIQTRMHILHLDRTDFHISLQVSIPERLAAKHPNTTALRGQVVRIRLLHLFRIKETRRRAETQRRERRIHLLLALAARSVCICIMLLRRHINSRHQFHTHFLAILRHIKHLR